MRLSEAGHIRRIFAPLVGTREDLRRIAIWGFIVLGISFRLRQYLFDRSLGQDESMLAVNIIERSAAALLRPLDYTQSAPVGFLWLEKLVVDVFGSGEMSLRLLPFLAGIGSILLFVVVARRSLAAPAIPIALALFVLSNPLIYYSSAAKQYSTDVAVALALYLLVKPLLDAPTGTRRVAGFSAAGAVAVWFSHSAVFVLAGLGCGVLWAAAQKKDRSVLLKHSIVIAAWLASFAVFYFVSLRYLIRNGDLLQYWNGAFAPFPPSSPSAAMWYVNAFFDVFSNPLGLVFAGIAAVAAVIGAAELFVLHQGRFIVLVLPVALALLASMLRLYPFQGRLLLFLVPGLTLLTAAGLGSIWSKTRASLPLLSPLLIGTLLLEPLAYAGRDFRTPEGFEELRPVLEYIDTHRADGDLLYCYYSSIPAVQYYRLEGLIIPMQQVASVEARQNWKAYRDDLDRLRGRNRVWVLFSHVWRGSGVDEELLFLDYLDHIGKRLDSSRAAGASVYLYDLSSQAA